MHVTRTVNVMQSKSYFSTIYACTWFVFDISVQKQICLDNKYVFEVCFLRRDIITYMERGHDLTYYAWEREL